MSGFPPLFNFTIDLSFWGWFIGLDSINMAIVLYTLFGWIIFCGVFFKAGLYLWVKYRRENKYIPHWKWVLLAVDIPPLFIQTPKAVEQIFAHLSGAAMHINVRDKYWIGKRQKWFSFEIVSIEGYIQFLIRTEVAYRDLVEASVYAQYPEAEITEVEDYVDYIPNYYPNKEYDVMGVEFKLQEKLPYPIRTYPSFEYSLSKDVVFSDPMAAILESFTRIGRGEHMWMQLLVEPTDNHWKEEGIELAKKMMGQEPEHKSNPILSLLADAPQAFAREISNIWQWNFEPREPAHGADKKEISVNRLSPGAKDTVLAVEEKIAKIGFKSKLRVLYAGRIDVYKGDRYTDSFVGAISQFSVQNRNALIPYMQTHSHYDTKHHSKSFLWKRTFVKTFKKRKERWKKCRGYILNIEELATIWHFPLPFVKAPLVSKSGAKRGEPPMGLPVEMSEEPLRRRLPSVAAHIPEAAAKESAEHETPPGPPENLPFG